LYTENFQLKVVVSAYAHQTEVLYLSNIKKKAKYNSWCSFGFKDGIFLVKGVKFSIIVETSGRVQYQHFPQAQIKRSLSAAKCSAFVDHVSVKNTGCESSALAERKDCPSLSCIVKSLSYILIN